MERLQKILAQAGIASRRHAEEMILAGRVRVNGQVVNQLGVQVNPDTDKIMVDQQPVLMESKAYFLLHKPKGYISDRDDTANLKTALDLIPGNLRLFAAGRLDLNSEGLLFLTNDGELANRLTHPRYEHEKEYLVLVFGVPDDKMLERLTRGIPYEGEWLRADEAERAGRRQEFGEAGRDETWLRIVLHEGKKRQIRHMCAALGHPVKRLIRVRIGPLRIGNLQAGVWRKLTREEIDLVRSQAQPRAKAKPPRRPQTASDDTKRETTRPASPARAPKRETRNAPRNAKPAPAGSRPPTRNGKPPARNANPISRQGKPPARTGKPAPAGSRPPTRNGKPPARNANPISRQSKPPARTGKPAPRNANAAPRKYRKP